jgi:hypothetical protein
MKIKHGKNEITVFDFEEGVIYEFMRFLRAFAIVNNIKLEEVSVKPIKLKKRQKKKIEIPKMSEKKKEEYLFRNHDFQKWREKKN